jgi:acyl dehydratase
MMYEQLEINTLYTTRAKKVMFNEIVDFATEFDPQYIHVNESKASKSIFGGIIASGLHTLAISFKLWLELDVIGEDIIGGVGLDNIKFLYPVYPDDSLSVQAVLTEKTPHKFKPDRGFFKLQLSTFNQHEQKVLSSNLVGLVKRNADPPI